MVTEHGVRAAARRDGFSAWLATETTQAARLRTLLRDTGIPADSGRVDL